MGKLEDCLISLREAGGLDPQLELELKTFIEGFQRGISDSKVHGPMTGEMLATERAIISALAIKKRQRTLVQRQAISDTINIRRIEAHPDGPGTGLLSLLTEAAGALRNPWTNVDRLSSTILGLAHKRAGGFLDELAPRLLGLDQDDKLMTDIMRELHGTVTGSADAKKFAQEFSDAAEFLRGRFNEAGGDIALRKDFGSPQYHSARAIQAARQQPWTEFIRPLLDRARMFDENGAPMSDLEFEATLASAFDTLSTDGLSKLADSRPGHGVKLANKHRDHRTLVFNDGDDWVKYQQKFGEPDMWAGLTGHLSQLSHEIALLEQLGPNPRAAWERMKIRAKQLGVSEGQISHVQDPIFRFVAGDTQQTKSRRLASFGGGLRSMLISSKLGSAFLSALSDPAYGVLTARMNGLSVTRIMQRQIAALTDQRGARRLATRLGLVNEAALMRAMATNRFIDSSYGSGFWQKASEVVIRASGLQVWTDAGRQAFGMEWMAEIARIRGNDWDTIPVKMRKTLARYNFSASDWEVMRSAKTYDEAGESFFEAENVMEITELLDSKGNTIREVSVAERKIIANRFMGMINTEMDFAVPMPNAAIRGIIAQGLPRGSLPAEIFRGAALFKTFPVTVLYTHVARAVGLARAGDHGAYLAQLAAFTTLGGAVATQAYEISRGRTPRALDARFWGAAALKGGGMGIFGDFLYNGIGGRNRYGQEFTTAMAGPVAGLVDDMVKLIGGNLGALSDGRDTNFGADLLKFASRYTPGSSIWYARLGLERLFFDQLQLLADPRAHRSFRASERRARSTFGNGYYWRRGQTLPEAAAR